MSLFLSWKQSEWSQHRPQLRCSYSCLSTALLLQLSQGFWQGGSQQARRWNPVRASAVMASHSLPTLTSLRAWPYLCEVISASSFLKTTEKGIPNCLLAGHDTMKNFTVGNYLLWKSYHYLKPFWLKGPVEGCHWWPKGALKCTQTHELV